METLFIRPPAPAELLPQNAELPNPQEALDLVALNARFRRLDPFNRVLEVFGMFRPEEILVTSSFGITSGVLLGMVSKAAPGHPVHFIDTTYHFPETLAYKEQLRERLRLNIVTREDPQTSQRLDQRLRAQLLGAFAVTAALCAALSLPYTDMRLFGLPALSLVLFFLAGAFGLMALVAARRG